MEHFSAYKLNFICEATTTINLPYYNGSTLRGAFFSALRRDFCLNRAQNSCFQCSAAEVCPICRLVATVEWKNNRGAEIPRPFVLEPVIGEKTSFEHGETFSFGITLFGNTLSLFPYLILAIQHMGEIGLGNYRKNPGRFILREVKAVNPLSALEQSIYSNDSRTVKVPDLAITHHQVLEFSARLNDEKLCMVIMTPLRMIIQGTLVQKLTFPIFMQRLLRRLTDLYRFCCNQELVLGFSGLLKKAEEVWVVQDNTHWVDISSYSNRRRARTPTGGLIGEIIFEGSLKAFLPLVVWGMLTHVGKNATRGNGWYRIADSLS